MGTMEDVELIRISYGELKNKTYDVQNDTYGILSGYLIEPLVKALLDNPNYDNDVEALKESYKDDLAEIEAWEEELEQQKSDCETEISMLKGYIDSWQTALQSNIQKSHTYGAQ